MPRQPKLFDWVWVLIEPLDTANTRYDTNAREQIQLVGRKATVRIRAQIEYRDFTQHGQADAVYDRGGYIGNEKGYILIRYIDALALSYIPAFGDKIVMIGDGSVTPQPVTTFVHRLKPTIHKRRLGKTAVKLYFQDRKPAINV